ncbi:cytochrome P450 [Nonomuraea sp. NPDC001699]
MPHAPASSPKTLPLYRVVPRLVKDPVSELAKMGTEADGRIVRLDLGPFRPYLISHPDHVQQILKTDAANFVREGTLWQAVRRVTGHGILSEGDTWSTTRKILQPLFTVKHTASLAEDMTELIDDYLRAFDGHARTGRPVDAGREMTTIINQAVAQVLFGGRISRETAAVLAPEFATCATSIAFRLLLPFVPDSVPLPGDRAFMAAKKKIDEIVYPLIEQAVAETSHGKDTDVLAALVRGRRGPDGEVDVHQVRHDLVSVYGTATETTAMSLTWLWGLLHEHPEVDARLREEIARLDVDGPVRPAQVAELPYLRMVLQELLRIYPTAWIVPRQTLADTEVGGVRIKAGTHVLISPFSTHRLPEFWDRPLEFDPDRWADGKGERRHRYAFIPFGAGPHICLGQHLFYVEAPLVVANLLSRYRPELTNPQPLTALPGASTRPKEKLMLRLHPIERTARA